MEDISANSKHFSSSFFRTFWFVTKCSWRPWPIISAFRTGRTWTTPGSSTDAVSPSCTCGMCRMSAGVWFFLLAARSWHLNCVTGGTYVLELWTRGPVIWGQFAGPSSCSFIGDASFGWSWLLLYFSSRSGPEPSIFIHWTRFSLPGVRLCRAHSRHRKLCEETRGGTSAFLRRSQRPFGARRRRAEGPAPVLAPWRILVLETSLVSGHVGQRPWRYQRRIDGPARRSKGNGWLGRHYGPRRCGAVHSSGARFHWFDGRFVHRLKRPTRHLFFTIFLFVRIGGLFSLSVTFRPFVVEPCVPRVALSAVLRHA